MQILPGCRFTLFAGSTCNSQQQNKTYYQPMIDSFHTRSFLISVIVTAQIRVLLHFTDIYRHQIVLRQKDLFRKHIQFEYLIMFHSILFGIVFFAPYYVFGISTPYMYRLYAVIIGFSLNYAAYFAEIYRSGIQSIPQGQREAAQVMGYGRRQTFFRIIFPQMVKRVMPPVTNEVITLVKDTSLAFAIAYTEMFTMAKQIASAQASLMPLFIAGLFYYIFNFVVAFVM